VSSDYDSWKTDEAPEAWEAATAVFAKNAARVTALPAGSIPKM
jgi:5'-methylthioadenosine phosphorylase